MTGESLHPHHDDVAETVRRWYTTPVPRIGVHVERRWYGFLNPGGPARSRLVLTADDAGQVAGALAEASAESQGLELEVWVDSRSRAGRLHEALVAAGCAPEQDTTFLALVGPIAAREGPPDLAVEEVAGEPALRRWSAVKVQAFAGNEALPNPASIAIETAHRLAEAPIAGYQLATLAGEPVSVLAWYTGRDQMAFNLATRVPYRHRGIGQSLLARWAARGVASGCRSLLINADDGGPAAALYRRMGFVDEVYWRRRYRLTSTTSPALATSTGPP